MDLTFKRSRLQCSHEDFLLAPAVERTPNPETNKMDFKLVMSIRCSDCDTPFLFSGPVGMTEDGKQLHVPIRTEDTPVFLSNQVGMG